MSFLDQYQKITTKIYLEKSLKKIWKSFASVYYLNPLFLIRKLILLLIFSYRTIGTSFLGGCCRFEPSCSEYAMICFNKHCLGRAIKLTLLRILKCRPYGPVGYDPVPLFDNMEN
jgi:hypothetical protein